MWTGPRAARSEGWGWGRVGRTLGITFRFLTLTTWPGLQFPRLLTLGLPHPTPKRPKHQLEASRTSSFYFYPKPHFQMSLQQSEIPHKQGLEKNRKTENETVGSEKQKEKMEPLEKGVSLRRWGQGEEKGRRRGGGKRACLFKGVGCQSESPFHCGRRGQRYSERKSKGPKKETGETRILPAEQSQPQSRLASRLQLESEFQRHG